MATDPYHDVQQEIQTSLQTATQLRASYVRIRNMAVREDSEELVWARNELKATLAALEADLEDLEDSVRIVENSGGRMFGIDQIEVQNRRQYVEHVRREIENMRSEVSDSSSSSKPTHPLAPSPRNSAYMSYPPTAPRPTSMSSPAPPGDEDEDDQRAWAREEQQMMIRQQDSTMDSISNTIQTLAQQAGLMGQEISEHNELLDDLEQGVDRTDTKLNSAMARMRKFIRQSEEKSSGYCIVFLIIILMVLLIVVILV